MKDEKRSEHRVGKRLRLAAQAAWLGGFGTFWPGGGFRDFLNPYDRVTGPTINMARPELRGFTTPPDPRP
jgi:hypothetical protein